MSRCFMEIFKIPFRHLLPDGGGPGSDGFGEEKKAQAMWKLVETYICEHEDQVQQVFDVFEFIATLGRRMR